jgi:hypothetical protein
MFNTEETNKIKNSQWVDQILAIVIKAKKIYQSYIRIQSRVMTNLVLESLSSSLLVPGKGEYD